MTCSAEIKKIGIHVDARKEAHDGTGIGLCVLSCG